MTILNVHTTIPGKVSSPRKPLDQAAVTMVTIITILLQLLGGEQSPNDVGALSSNDLGKSEVA